MITEIQEIQKEQLTKNDFNYYPKYNGWKK